MSMFDDSPTVEAPCPWEAGIDGGNATGADGLKLTNGQQVAMQKFTAFLLDPQEQVFVIKGYSGTGKSTLVKTIIQRLEALQKMARAMDPDYKPLTPMFTATTNKAGENFSLIMGGAEVSTIHSALGLMVQVDPQTRESSLVSKTNKTLTNTLLFIDEASYIDSTLLDWIFKRVDKRCKIVFMGDPAQLLAVRCNNAPVFAAKFSTAELKEVVRQADGNPIIELSTKFRHAVETGRFFSFHPDGHHIQHLARDAFDARIVEEMSREDWKYADSKVLAYTNERVIAYNQAIRDIIKGDPHFEIGDYAVNNRYISNNKFKIATDQLVCLTDISKECEQFGVKGRMYTIDYRASFFGPASREEWKQVVARFKAEGKISLLDRIDREWIDLRAAFAQTVNKSQGSTYGSVFVDLDDIRRCRNGNTLARLLYVGISRARNHVYFTGDLV